MPRWTAHQPISNSWTDGPKMANSRHFQYRMDDLYGDAAANLRTSIETVLMSATESKVDKVRINFSTLVLAGFGQQETR